MRSRPMLWSGVRRSRDRSERKRLDKLSAEALRYRDAESK